MQRLDVWRGLSIDADLKLGALSYSPSEIYIGVWLLISLAGGQILAAILT
ncbi:hypothetical protein ACQ4OC_06610 [Yersinia sp. J1]|nr:hypothetical protein [Yersinia entomophaga]